MRLLFISFFFLFHNSFSGTGLEDFCKKSKDLTPGMPPVRSQDSSPWCATFSALSLLGHHFLQQTEKNVMFSVVEANALDTKNKMPVLSFHKGTWTARILSGIQRKGSLCSEQSAPFDRRLYEALDNFPNGVQSSLQNYYDATKTSGGEIHEDSCYKSYSFFMKDAYIPVMKELKELAVNSESFEEFVTRLYVTEKCKKNRIRIPPFSINIFHTIDDLKFLKKISDTLDLGYPLATGVCFLKLLKLPPEELSDGKIDSCSAHAMVIVGKRIDPETKECQIKLRNSHGKNWRRDGFDIKDGYLWISAAAYLRALPVNKKGLKERFVSWLTPTPAKSKLENSLTTDKWRYRGKTLGEKPYGSGVKTFRNGKVIDGQFKNGHPHEFCKITHPDGTTDEGLWENGERKENSPFETNWLDGSRFTGTFNEMRDGFIYTEGKYLSSDGETITGKFKDFGAHGICTREFSDGEVWKGPFREGLPYGRFTITWKGKDKRYEGTLYKNANGELYGDGILIKNGKRFSGKNKNGIFLKANETTKESTGAKSRLMDVLKELKSLLIETKQKLKKRYKREKQK